MDKSYLKIAEENHKKFIKETHSDFNSLMSKSTVQEQLVSLRKMSELTGVFHEAQIMQLKYWFVCLTNCEKYTITIDTENSKVTYKVLETKGKNPKNINSNLNKLQEYVKFLLGSKYSVVLEDSPWETKKKTAPLLKSKPSNNGKNSKKNRLSSKKR